MFALPLTNEYSYGEKYYITIEGLEKGSREFSVVSNPTEWESHCSTLWLDLEEYNYDSPSRYSIIDEASQSVYLLAHESVTILLKFLTWRKSRSER